MEEELIFEKEGEMPENWVSNSVFIRDGKGEIIELNVSDDKE